MIRTDVVVAILESVLLEMRPDWAHVPGVPSCTPVHVMCTSPRWSVL